MRSQWTRVPGPQRGRHRNNAPVPPHQGDLRRYIPNHRQRKPVDFWRRPPRDSAIPLPRHWATQTDTPFPVCTGPLVASECSCVLSPRPVVLARALVFRGASPEANESAKGFPRERSKRHVCCAIGGGVAAFEYVCGPAAVSFAGARVRLMGGDANARQAALSTMMPTREVRASLRVPRPMNPNIRLPNEIYTSRANTA